MSNRTPAPDPKLGYVWVAPPATQPIGERPFWQLQRLDPVMILADSLAEAAWRVDHLREQIDNLGIEPKGRTRQSLAEQLAERFMDASRLSASIQQLSDEERRYFAHLELQSGLQNLHIAPDSSSLWRGFSTAWSRLTTRLIKAGLILVTETDGLYLPIDTRRRLPHLTLDFPSVRAPAHVEPPSDPHEFLSRIQQLLGLLQIETFQLRDRVRWKAPKYPYAEPIVSWPIAPTDAKILLANVHMERSIELLPPESYPNDAALDAWAGALGITTDEVEWLYALLVEGDLILEGSPISIDHDLVHAWMALTPGRQLAHLFSMYRDTDRWAVWWPAWRAQELRVIRSYQGVWNLISIDGSIARSIILLRQAMLEVLSLLPEDTWIATQDLIRWLTELFPRPETHRHLMGMDPSCIQGGWPKFVEELLLQTLRGPLRVFGLVDIGPSLEDMEALRLHGLQDLHWGRIDEVLLEATGHFSPDAVRFNAADTKVEVTLPAPPDFISTMLTWAKPAGLSRNVARYRLDAEQLHQAFENGEDPASLSAAWRAGLGFDPLPEIVAWWEAWWSRYGHVRIYPAQVLLQTRDAMTLEELRLALPSLQDAIVSKLTPEAALLRSESVDSLLDDLARQGYMPKEIA